MYLYLGNDSVVRTSDIIGIFDLDNTSTSRHTRAFLSKAQKEGAVIEVMAELPKSFVLCKRGKKTTVYLSQISPATLKKRTEFIEDIQNTL